MNELKYGTTEILILKLLYEEFKKGRTENHAYRISKSINRSIPTTSDNLKILESKGLVKSKPNPNFIVGRRQPIKFYELTERGQALTWALLNTDDLVNLYNKFVRK